jgi:hypothetical protein
VNRYRESAAIGNRHDLRALPALRLAHAGASVLGSCEAPIDEGVLQIQIAFVVERLGEDLENAPQQTRAHPLLKPPVARLIGLMWNTPLELAGRRSGSVARFTPLMRSAANRTAPGRIESYHQAIRRRPVIARERDRRHCGHERTDKNSVDAR